jgi:hypothetical protein
LTPPARPTLEEPLYGCGRCGRDFSSLAAFDSHFVNVTADHYWSCEKPDGFRCMTEEEIEVAFELDNRGRFRTPLTERKLKQLAALRNRPRSPDAASLARSEG